jgi:hypothetical protein
MAGAQQSEFGHRKREDRTLKYALLLLAAAISLPAMADEQPDLYGRYELIKLPALGQTLKAKMDTGAMTASLSAKDIEPFKRDGEDWVRFRLAVDGAENTVYEHPLVRIAEIKKRTEEGDTEAKEVAYSQRPVVECRSAWARKSAPSRST